MKESHDNLEPLKIGGSAFSNRNKQQLAQHGIAEKEVTMGTKPRDQVSSQQRYIPAENSKHARKLSQTKPRTQA